MVIEEAAAGAHCSCVCDCDASSGVRVAQLPRFIGYLFRAKSGCNAGDCWQGDVLSLENSSAHAVGTDGLHGDNGNMREAVSMQTLNDAGVEAAAAYRAHLICVRSVSDKRAENSAQTRKKIYNRDCVSNGKSLSVELRGAHHGVRRHARLQHFVYER